MATQSSSTVPLPSAAGSETNPNISVVPTAQKRKAPSELNQFQVRKVARAGLICTAAKTPAFATVLAGRDISAGFLTTLEQDIAAVQNTATSALACTNKKKGATLTGQASGEDLVAELRSVQASARQKFFHSNPAKLGDYLVGERLEPGSGTLDQSAQTIITNANTDRPPGVDTAFITKLEGKRAAVTAAKSTQVSEGGEGKSERETRDANVKSIVDRTQQIQFAADAAWPPSVPGNGGIRRQFYLPLDRPFVA